MNNNQYITTRFFCPNEKQQNRDRPCEGLILSLMTFDLFHEWNYLL